MELEKIKFPEHLNEHDIPASTLAQIPEDQRRVAIELNISGRRMRWLMEEFIIFRNLMVDHDKILELWKRLYWLAGLLLGAALTFKKLGIL